MLGYIRSITSPIPACCPVWFCRLRWPASSWPRSAQCHTPPCGALPVPVVPVLLPATDEPLTLRSQHHHHHDRCGRDAPPPAVTYQAVTLSPSHHSTAAEPLSTVLRPCLPSSHKHPTGTRHATPNPSDATTLYSSRLIPFYCFTPARTDLRQAPRKNTPYQSGTPATFPSLPPTLPQPEP